jgi:sec-independent protein translocase protein TatA
VRELSSIALQKIDFICCKKTGVASRIIIVYNNAMQPVLGIFNMGGQEMILIFIVVLLLFGAKKIPELARGLGKSMGEFKKAREEFETEITKAADDVKIREASGKEPQDS